MNVPLAPLWPAPAEAAAAPELAGRAGFRAGFEARLLPELCAHDGGVVIYADNADRPYEAERRDSLLTQLCGGERRRAGRRPADDLRAVAWR